MSINLETLYQHRFAGVDNSPLWREITRYFNRSGRVSEQDRVCDIACGNGEFLKAIRCEKKYGVDLRQSSELSDDVHFLQKDVLDFGPDDFGEELPNLFFVSNFLEGSSRKFAYLPMFV